MERGDSLLVGIVNKCFIKMDYLRRQICRAPQDKCSLELLDKNINKTYIDYHHSRKHIDKSSKLTIPYICVWTKLGKNKCSPKYSPANAW